MSRYAIYIATLGNRPDLCPGSEYICKDTETPEGDEVPNYHSTVTFTLEEFKSKLLAQYPDADLSGDPAGWFQNTVPNSAGGVEQVDVGGVTVSGGPCAPCWGCAPPVLP